MVLADLSVASLLRLWCAWTRQHRLTLLSDQLLSQFRIFIFLHLKYNVDGSCKVFVIIITHLSLPC